MYNKSRNINFLEIFCKIRFRESFDTFQLIPQSTLHSLEPECVTYTLRNFMTLTVCTIKWHGQIFKELRPVSCHTSPDFIKLGYWHSTWIRISLKHKWCNRTH